MSIPRDILDQLLSGYLDDVLSADEQTRIEQLIADDPAIASELEDLRRIRGVLRQIGREDNRVRLDDGFADRVMGAAVAQASNEGLGEDHPLVKVSEHPSVDTNSSRVSIGKIAGTLVALAASITIGIVMLQPPPEPLNLADSSLDSHGLSVNQGDSVATDVDPDAGVAPAIVPKDLVADTQSAMDALVPGRETNSVAQNDSVASDPVARDTETQMLADDPSPSVDQIVANRVAETSGKSQESPEEVEVAAPMGVSNVLTFMVKRTEFGRQSRAVREALRGASIEPAQEKALTEGMVNAVSKSFQDDGGETYAGSQLLYLEVPAKKVDVLLARLLTDQEGIEAVSLAMMATPPVKRFVEALNPQQLRDIRHGKSWEFSGNEVGQVAASLSSNLQFIPMGRSFNGIPLESSETNGQAQMSRLLIVVQ